MMRSVLEWEISLSCHRATFSQLALIYPLITLAQPQMFSELIGLRLWGIAEEPFWPLRKASSASRTSVLWRLRTSKAICSKVEAITARVAI